MDFEIVMRRKRGLGKDDACIQSMSIFADMSGEHGCLQCLFSNVIHSIQQVHSELEGTPADCAAILYTLVLDLWVPLAMGARVVIAPAASMKDFAAVRDFISKHKVASFTGVPSALQVRHSLPYTSAFVGLVCCIITRFRTPAAVCLLCLGGLPGCKSPSSAGRRGRQAEAAGPCRCCWMCAPQQSS